MSDPFSVAPAGCFVAIYDLKSDEAVDLYNEVLAKVLDAYEDDTVEYRNARQAIAQKWNVAAHIGNDDGPVVAMYHQQGVGNLRTITKFYPRVEQPFTLT
jgi:hypothetical protein